MADQVDLKQRFEITVPWPSVRINLGEPIKEDGEPTFGYVGMSLQSDVDLFIDVNKDTFQQASNVLHQAGGEWLQYADGPMYLTTLDKQHFASGNQLTIVAGAPYGNSTGLDHGTRVRAHKYNNLDLHYRIEEVQNGLFEFFYGRRKRESKDKDAKFAYAYGFFDRKEGGNTQVETEAELKGFRAMVDKSQTELGLATSDPLWLDTVFSEKAKDSASCLEYGFSPYLKRFDPYNLIDPATADPKTPFANLVLTAKNALAKGRRLIDVSRKVGACITDNAVSATILRAADGLAAFGSAWSAMNRVYERHPFQAVRWVDEYNSGFAARAGAVADYTKREHLQQATITSGAGPFALEHGHTMSVYAPTTGSPASQSTPVVATAAFLESAEDTTSGWSGSVTVTLDDSITQEVVFAASDTASASTIQTALSGLSATVTVDGQRLKIESQLLGANSRVKVEAEKSVLAGLGMASQLPTSVSGPSITGVAAPSGAPAGEVTFLLATESSDLQFVVDFSDGNLDAIVAAINDAFVAADPDHAVQELAFASEGVLRMEQRFSSSSSLHRSDLSALAPYTGLTQYTNLWVGDSRAALEALGLLASSGPVAVESAPPSPENNVADVSSVTAAEVANLLSSVSNVEVAEVNGAVEIKSTTRGASSWVKGARFEYNSMANALGLHNVEDTIEDTAADNWSTAVADFQYVNHELQKLPEDARNLTRPITECLEDCMGVVSNLEKMVESLVDGIPAILNLPGPPAAIGIFGKEGITLGTPDRIVGAAGGGFVFLADGGTGQRDHGKFIPYAERGINAVLEWKPGFLGGADADEPVKNLGFRVCSDASVNLSATTTAELLALGRGMVSNKAVGIGVARVAGSRAAEVAGYEKVSIGARAPEGSDAAPDGGIVEVVAHRIVIGAGEKATQHGLGIKKKPWQMKKVGDGSDVSRDLEGRAWAADPSKVQPLTKIVEVESTDETKLRTSTHALRLVKDDGLYFGSDIDENAFDSKKTLLSEAVQYHEASIKFLNKEIKDHGKKLAKLKAANRPTVQHRDHKRQLETALEAAEKDLEDHTTALSTAKADLKAHTEDGERLTPVLHITDEEIVLGFRKNVGGKIGDGPHLKINKDGFWLETGEPDKEVSIVADAAGKKLTVQGETEWSTQKDVSLKPTGKLNLTPTGDVSLTGSNVTVRPNSGLVKIG